MEGECKLLLLLALSACCVPRAGGHDASAPYLSVVVGGRNDDWGGNFSGRLEACLQTLFLSAGALGLHTQAVVVDYNPPSNAAPLSALPWPTPVPPSTLHFVTVSSELHAQVAATPRWSGYAASLFEYVAKNVGIRASEGEFVLVTNPDIIMSWDLVRFIAQRSLSPTAFYTIPRSDLPQDPPAHLRGRELDMWCEGAARHAEGLAPGDFLLASSRVWHALGGFPESGSNAGVDTWTLSALRLSSLREMRFRAPLRIFHQPHAAGPGSRGRAMREKVEARRGSNAHAEAALMSRAMRVMRRRMVWAERGAAPLGAWGLGGTIQAAGAWAPPALEACDEAASGSPSGVCLDGAGDGTCALATAPSVRRRGQGLCDAGMKRLTEAPGRGEEGACAEVSCCVALHMLVGDVELAKHIATAALPHVLGSCAPERAAALSATIGAVEHLSLFPQEAHRAQALAARLDRRWAGQARRARCFQEVFAPLLAAVGQSVDPREVYSAMETRMVGACGGELEVPLEALCEDRVLSGAADGPI